MRAARRGLADTLSVSALDLFASALGVFVVMFIILMPFYLKRPSVEEGLLGAEARLAEATDAMAESQKGAASARRRLSSAEDALGGMANELETKTAELDEMNKALKQAQAALANQPKPQIDTGTSRGRGGGNIAIERLDLVIVMDITGSMRNELRDVQANLASLARILNELSPDLRLGFVAYRDTDSPPVLRSFPMTRMSGGNLQQMLRFTRSLSAKGGGDVPEPVDRALQAAIDMSWRRDASGRIIVIGDAPAHVPRQITSYNAARRFADSSPGGKYDRRVSTILTGDAGGATAYFEQLAASGNGEVSSHRGAMIESVMLAILE
ncbi:MAG: vWA domain-containing protein [Pseudomonadota bacterium]